VHTIGDGAAGLAQNARGIPRSTQAVDADGQVEGCECGPSGTDRVDAGAAGIDGTGGGRTADGEHADAAIRGRTRIAKPCDAGESAAAPPLDAIIVA
jgi:hypothetical protein